MPEGVRSRLGRLPVHTYRGNVPWIRDSEARFTVREGSFEGVVLTPDEWYYIEPLRNYSPASDPADMVVYRRSDIRFDSLGVCGTTLAHRIGAANELVGPQVLAASSGIKTADIATEADYEYVLASGGAEPANAAILEILNQVDGIYQTQLSIALRVVYQHVWATPDDPYNSTAGSALLSEFKAHWNTNFYNITYDLAHMWTGKDMDGSTIGIAYLSVVCEARTYSYGISQRFNSSPGKYILTAHEMGHNFGASHPDQASPPQTDCTNSIMHSSVGTGTSFCPFSLAEIGSFLSAGSSCLAAGPAAPSNLAAIAASTSQINLSWQDNSMNESNFVVERKTGAGGAWAQIAAPAANAIGFSNTGLASSTTYYYRVAATGAGGASAYSNEAFATTLFGQPTVTGINPGSGRAGTLVTITGSNLGGATAVRFNTTNATAFTVVSASQLTTAVPSGATTGYVTVVTPAGSASSPSVFTISTNRCDINNDRVVNALDMQLLINSILGFPGSPANGDINSDGKTNVLDLQVMIIVILGLTGCPG